MLDPFFGSPFGGIPRNWKLRFEVHGEIEMWIEVPPSGGSLEIGNVAKYKTVAPLFENVPPSGGSLEIGNSRRDTTGF